MSIIAKTAETIEEVIAIASELRNQWIDSFDMAILPWFRGQADAEWTLTPKFYRAKPTDSKTECEIREEFITHAPAFSNVSPRNEWEWYLLMQHYGAPTRLLDWTDGALIALYFAVRDNDGDRHASIWVLDPWWLNESVIDEDEVVPVGDPLLPPKRKEHRWLPSRFKTSRPLPASPIAVFPGHFDKRIGAQRSTFTVHGRKMNGLVDLAEKDPHAHLVKITVPSWTIGNIKRSLDTCGIDETTVFPDLQSLSRVVEGRWKSADHAMPHVGVFTRLKPSRTHGIGVFAITDIPKHTRLFAGDLPEMVWISKGDIARLPAQVKALYKDFGPEKNGRYGCPRTFNRLTMSWYLNDSKNPNVSCDEYYNFSTLRDVRNGEELTVDYSSLP